MVKEIGIERDEFIRLYKANGYTRSGRARCCGLPCCVYILKDKSSDTYKIGVTSNLRSRISDLYHLHPYDICDFSLFAYKVGYEEESLRRAIIESGARMASAYSWEMFILTSDDISFIVEHCGFTLIGEDGIIPYTFKYADKDRKQIVVAASGPPPLKMKPRKEWKGRFSKT